MTEATKTLALHPDWLDGGEVTVSADNALLSNGAQSVNLVSGNAIDYGLDQYPTQWYYTTPTKIRLTLTEVQKLRAAAKKDKALKEALRKFTPHIEIEVDFP